MVLLGSVVALAATAMGLSALVLLVRANPSMQIPVLTGRVAVDPPRAKGLRAGASGLAVLAGPLAAAEIGMWALCLSAPAILLPLVAAAGYNLWIGRAGVRPTV